jgi:hypothetical protein
VGHRAAAGAGWSLLLHLELFPFYRLAGLLENPVLELFNKPCQRGSSFLFGADGCGKHGSAHTSGFAFISSCLREVQAPEGSSIIMGQEGHYVDRVGKV